MKILAVKDVKKLFVAITIILLGTIVLGQVAVTIMANDYKKEMIAHDYAVAGYLLRNDLDKSQVRAAFTAEKTSEDLASGQLLLQAAGYDDSLNPTLLPPVKIFHEKYAVLALFVSIAFSLAIMAVLLIYSIKQNQKLEAANTDILEFMNGNYNIRLNDHEEGALSQLASSINVMATSLTTHIAKEKQNKEFLRDTIADISHQLKTPLAALQMYNEIIQDENTGNDVVESFTHKSSNEGKAYTDPLLVLAPQYLAAHRRKTRLIILSVVMSVALITGVFSMLDALLQFERIQRGFQNQISGRYAGGGNIGSPAAQNGFDRSHYLWPDRLFGRVCSRGHITEIPNREYAD